jgi:outer membrane protein
MMDIARKHGRRIVRIIALVASIGLAVATSSSRADEYKIGVINTDRILREAAPAKDAAKRIEDEFKAREAAVTRLERELGDLKSNLDRDAPTITEADRSGRQREIDTRARDIDRMRRQIAEDLKVRQFDEMNKLKERLDALLTKIAREQGYDLILQDGVFVGRSVDMTDTVIKALAAP